MPESLNNYLRTLDGEEIVEAKAKAAKAVASKVGFGTRIKNIPGATGRYLRKQFTLKHIRSVLKSKVFWFFQGCVKFHTHGKTFLGASRTHRFIFRLLNQQVAMFLGIVVRPGMAFALLEGKGYR